MPATLDPSTVNEDSDRIFGRAGADKGGQFGPAADPTIVLCQAQHISGYVRERAAITGAAGQHGWMRGFRDTA